MRVALAYGGKSAEHVVSVHSALVMERVLGNLGYDVMPLYIDLDGIWYREEKVSPQPEKTRRLSVIAGRGIAEGGKVIPIDLVFPVTHGHQGEDGCLQGLLSIADLPCAGCDTLSSSVMMFKAIATLLFREAGIPTVETYTLEAKTIDFMVAEGSFGEELERSVTVCGERLFIKPEDCGSSIGVTALPFPTESSFEEAVLNARRYSERVLVQRYLMGAEEIECAVLEDGEEIVVSPPLSVYNPEKSDAFLSYDVKYRSRGGDKLVRPSLSRREEKDIETWARRAFIVGKCSGYARADFFRHDGRIYLNEVNTLPGMTEVSHYPVLIAQCGYSLEQAVEAIITSSLSSFARCRLRTYRPPQP